MYYDHDHLNQDHKDHTDATVYQPPKLILKIIMIAIKFIMIAIKFIMIIFLCLKTPPPFERQDRGYLWCDLPTHGSAGPRPNHISMAMIDDDNQNKCVDDINESENDNDHLFTISFADANVLHCDLCTSRRKHLEIFLRIS